MHLPDPHGHGYYTTFYVLAVLTTLLLALYEGHRRRYPLRPWLVLLACWLLAFIVGTKLITIPAASWLPLLQGQPWPVDTARSVLGGAVSGGLAVLALRRWLGLGWSVFDALALPQALGLAVQCVGCLLTGCCFGAVSPTGLVGPAGGRPYSRYRSTLPARGPNAAAHAGCVPAYGCGAVGRPAQALAGWKQGTAAAKPAAAGALW
ncbi:hypothetical protein GCM10023185_32790 [Hymenobacter saemangeumensis]|uniref:Prolipoprotein diacylglyceryl transferase n=1 Tax=Hymenobacter saemangeumensis TaxID=1084522 RepID=A0ABP8INK6_9BACT